MAGALLLAWAWYRGTLYWRVRTERARLAALTAEPVTPPAASGAVGPVRNFLTGEDDMRRLTWLRERVNAVEGGPRDAGR